MLARGAWLIVLGAGACTRAHPPPPHKPAPNPMPIAVQDAGDWVRHIDDAPPAPSVPKPAPPPEARAAVMSDDVEASDEPVAIGRLVYRVSFYVPASFRDRRAAVRAPAGELHVDVSHDRLRARFVGPGWPVPDGSEVRLRADLPGVYLFDGQGGRSLGAGQLAAWFEGREHKKIESLAGVWHDFGPAPAKPIPSELLCALLCEWAHLDRDALGHRCEGKVPPAFRVGPWSGELTAVVPMELPRRALRADEADPPKPIASVGNAVLIEPAALTRLPPLRAQSAPGPASLWVENHSDTRAIIIAQGVPIAWTDAGQSVRVDGFIPGVYMIGAIRPLGILRMMPKAFRVPGRLSIGRALGAPAAAKQTADGGMANSADVSSAPAPKPREPAALAPPAPSEPPLVPPANE